MNAFTYHIYTRGVKKHTLFRCRADYAKALAKLKELCRRLDIRLYGYVFMPNHIHLQPAVTISPEQITHLMHRWCTSYAMYFNKKYLQSGHVFQGNYRAEPIATEWGILRASRYINQNSIDLSNATTWEDAVSCLRTSEWCSYRYFLKAGRVPMLDYRGILRYFNLDLSMFSSYMESPEPRLELAKRQKKK